MLVRDRRLRDNVFMADLASIAAATSAGYSETVLDRGSSWSASSRYEVTWRSSLWVAPVRA